MRVKVTIRKAVRTKIKSRVKHIEGKQDLRDICKKKIRVI